MVFSSTVFLFVFLPLLIIMYFAPPRANINYKNIVLLVFSLLFYWYGEPKFYIIMLASIAANYLFGILLHVSGENNNLKKLWVFISVAFNIGILIYFKYTMFIVRNVNGLFGLNFDVGTIVKPIGISFFTFQGLSYVLDIYFGNAKYQKNILNVALYISLFPQLIAGPIVRYDTVAAEINCRSHTTLEFSLGIRRFMVGLGKKMLLANSLGVVADKLFGIPAGELTVLSAWLAPIAYAFQIYFDFSGYSDMAIGLGRIFGFHFLENFNYPYISKSITEFWRRWHISLGTWFRDYVYIPMGGNRVSFPRHIRNILVVWLLTGIWHGAEWKFFVWGIYFGAILVAEKTFMHKILDKLWAPLAHLYAILLIVLGWGVFRAYNMPYAAELFKTQFLISGRPFADMRTLHMLIDYKFEFLAAAIACMPIAKLFKGKWTEEIKYVLAVLVFLASVVSILTSTFNPFIYFRF
jgi:alginate O-acetyltransferase complex protein AlgI